MDRARYFGLGLMHRLMENRTAAFVDGTIHSAPPRQSLAMRSWLAADAIAMRRFPPGSRLEGKHSGGTLSLSTRDRALTSWISLLRRAPHTILERHSSHEAT